MKVYNKDNKEKKNFIINGAIVRMYVIISLMIRQKDFKLTSLFLLGSVVAMS